MSTKSGCVRSYPRCLWFLAPGRRSGLPLALLAAAAVAILLMGLPAHASAAARRSHPRPKVALPTAVLAGASIRLSGPVPPQSAQRVALQQATGARWRTLTSGAVKHGSGETFALVWQAPSTPGRVTLRLVVLSRGRVPRVLARGTVLIERRSQSAGSPTQSAGSPAGAPNGTGSPASVVDPTVTTLGCAPGPAFAGDPVSCLIVVNDIGASPTSPTGQATVGPGGGLAGGTCTLTPTGASNAASCTVSYTPTQAGTEQLSGAYPGDAAHSASQSNPSALTVGLRLNAGSPQVEVGGVVAVGMPSPLRSVTSLDPQAPTTPAGVSVSVDSGQLSLAAGMSSSPGDYPVTITGQGCASSGCGIPLSLSMTAVIQPIAAPQGTLEDFASPSPDRVAQAAGNDLQDELLVMLGTTDAPGTRAQADAAAAATGGQVAGGLSDTGIYQIRWGSPQDLAARTTQLESQPGVTGVSPDSVGVGASQSYAPLVNPLFDQPNWTWRYDQIDARQAWQSSTGSNVAVGIIDPGNVDPYQSGLNVIELDRIAVPGQHATHTAGLACGKPNGGGMVGIGWGCPIVSIRLGAPSCARLPCPAGAGRSTDGDVLAAMRRIAATSNVRVVNMSIGTESGCYTGADEQQVNAGIARESAVYRRVLSGVGKRIVWTMSAGNNCAPEATSPQASNADLPNVVTVAATNSDKTLASFSNYGSNVEVAAPGGVVPSTPAIDLHASCSDPTVQDYGRCGLLSSVFSPCPQGFCDAFGEQAGTSMAAPVVAGVAALVISKDPSLTANQVGDCITSTAGTGGVGSTSPPDGQPGGAYLNPLIPYSGSPIPIVNAAAAVACATAGGPVPSVTVSAVGNTDGPVGYGAVFTGPACGTTGDTGLLNVYADGNPLFSYGVSGSFFATDGWQYPLRNTYDLTAGTHQVTFACVLNQGGSEVEQWTSSGFAITLTGLARTAQAASSAPQGGTLTVFSGVAGDPCPVVGGSAPVYADYDILNSSGNAYVYVGGTSALSAGSYSATLPSDLTSGETSSVLVSCRYAGNATFGFVPASFGVTASGQSPVSGRATAQHRTSAAPAAVVGSGPTILMVH